MTKKDRRTFLQNIAALSVLAMPGTNSGQTNPPQTGRPQIQFDFAANLDKDDVYKFLDSNAMTWDAPLALPSLYSQSAVAKKIVGSIDKYPDDIPSTPQGQPNVLKGQPIRLWWARQAQCRVQQGTPQGQFVGSSEVVIPCSWQVTIQVFAVLLIKNDGSVPAAAQTKIETTFTNFQYPRDGDPLVFIQQAIASDPTVKTDYFSVVYTFSLTKVPNSLEIKRDQETTVRSLQTGQNLQPGQHPGTIWTGPNTNIPMQNYFNQRHIQLLCSEQEDFVGRVPAPRPDPHVKVLADGNEREAVQGIAQNDTPRACSNLKENDWPLLTIDFWPEFQVVMKDCTIDIGCGVHIVLTLPVLQMRISGHDLWVYTRYPNNLPSFVDGLVQQCAFEAGLEGAVVGVVLWNFAAGLAAFVGAFEDCINSHLQQTIECMVPGLGLVVSVKKDWFDIL